MATKMKKTLSLALALIMVLGMLPLTAFAAENGSADQISAPYAPTVEGNDVNWTASNTDTVTDEDNGVTVQKKIAGTNQENVFDITLNVTTKEQLKNLTVSPDAAVVVVLDVSNSMEDTLDGKVKLTQAKAAAKQFVTSLAEGAEGAQRMVSVVQFDTDAIAVQPWTNAVGAAETINSTIDSKVMPRFEYHECEISGEHTHEGSFIKKADWDDWRFVSASDGYICTVCGQYATTRFDKHKHCTFSGCKTPWDIKHTQHTVSGPHGDMKESGGDTNIEAGLQLASNLMKQLPKLDGCNQIDKRYVVLLSDGAPHRIISSSADRDSTTFIKGAEGNDDKDRAATVATQIRATEGNAATLYAISYAGHKNDQLDKNAKWLRDSIASPKGFFDAANNETLDLAFEKINEQIKLLAQAWTVADPMGDDVSFVEFNDGADVSNEVRKLDGSTIHWDLKRDTADHSDDTYTYSLSYRVKLNTDKVGFDEAIDHRTNGLTTLKYVVTKDGVVPENPEVLQLNFNVPSVNGTIPTVDFSIEYYKWDKKTGKYLDNPTDSENLGSQKLWSEVDAPAGYEVKYNDDGYQFDSCNFADGKMIVTNDAGGNVMKIYYKPVTTNVVVNRFFITHTTQLDGSVLDAQLNSTVNEHGAYVNDSFTAETADIDSYKFAESVQWGKGTKKSDSPTIAHLVAVTEENHNIINLYYEQSIDLRADASYTIRHHYAEQEWQLNADGKYELTTNKGSFGDDVTGKSKEGVVITATPNTRGDTYTVTSPSTEEGLKFTLVEGKDNGLTIEYLKAPTTVPDSTTVQVNHHYTTKTITIGGTDSATEHDTGEAKPAREGETWTFQPQAKEDFDISNVKAQTIKLDKKLDCYVVDFYYERTVDERVTTSVTVNTIENVYTMKVNEETGVAGYELTSSTAANPKSETFTKHANGDALYVGQTYAATIAEPDGFTLNVDASTENRANYPLTGTAANNVINLVYDKKIDELAEGSATVIHKYTTSTDFVDENGDVQTNVATFFEERDESKSGKVGEWFMAEVKTVPNTLPTEAPDTLYTLNDGQDLKVTLAAVDAEKTLNYSRKVNLLAETNVLVNYYCVTNTRHVVGGVVVTTSDIETVVPTAEPQTGTFYAGLKFSISPAAERGEFSFDNTLTTDAYQNIRLSAKTEDAGYANTINLYYSKTVEDLPTATVIVRDHYQTVRTYVNDAGVLVEDEKTVDTQQRDAVTPYIGTTYTASPDARDFVQTDAKYVLLGAPATASVLVAEETNYVDFYYTKTVNPTVPATVVVTHHYKQVGWKGETLSSEERGEEPVTSVAGVKFTATVETLGDYTLQNPAAVTLTLVEGANEIHLYYQQSVDNRVDTTVLVKHHYDLVDPNVEGGLIHEGAHTQSYTTRGDGAFVNNEFLAPQIPDSAGKTYTLNAERSDPTGGKLTLAALPNANVINLYYTRAYGDDEGFPVSGRKTYVGLTSDQYPTTTVYLSQAGVQKYSATVDNGPDGHGHFLFDNVAPGVYDISESASVAGYSYTAQYMLTAHSYGQEEPSPQLRALVQGTVDITSNPQITVVAATEYNLEITNTYTSNPTPPPTPGTTYYGITVKYVDEAGKELSAAHTERHYEGYSYDVTDKTTLEIADYTIKSVTGDTLAGRLNGDKVITVVYAPVVVIPDEPVPEGGKPGEVILPDTEPPKNELPEELEDGAVPLDAAPKTGDTTSLWTTLMAVSGFGLAALAIFKGKKKEEDSAE